MAIVVIAAVVILGKEFIQKPNVEVAQKQDGATTSAETNTSGVIVTHTSSGFSPADAKIKSGGTITWVNDGDSEIQIGANPHPVHTGNKEVSGGGFVLTLKPGEQTAVKMEKVGSFGYHDHLKSSQGGTITVE